MAEIPYLLPTTPWAMSAAGTDDPIEYTAWDFRRILFGLFSTEGALATTFFKVQQHSTGADYTIDITAGDAVVFGNPGGQYYAWSEAVVNIDLTAYKNPPATRTHKVWLSIYDKAAGSTVDSGARLVVTEDVGSGAPNPSGTPNANLLLAEVKIAPGQANIGTANITEKRTYAKLRTDMQQALPSIPTVYAMASGRTPDINIPSNASYYYGPITVKFPASRFSSTPRVTVTQSSAPSGSSKYLWKVVGTKTTQFQLYCYNALAADLNPCTGVTVDWIAIQAG